MDQKENSNKNNKDLYKPRYCWAYALYGNCNNSAYAKRARACQSSRRRLRKIFERFDGQFVSLYITKTIPHVERVKYSQEWEILNSGFDRRDPTELLGLDKPIKNIENMRSLILIDCRKGKSLRFTDDYFDERGNLMNYVSSDNKNTWVPIEKNSLIDDSAIQFCEPSAY